MKRLWIGIAAVLMGITAAHAQSMEDLNIQIHGYATQGFLYTTNNNIFTTNSSDGSPAWTEAVVNITAQPDPKLRIGVQARYSLLGNLGNQITLDWASADYKVNDRFGVRFGKVKTPAGMFNEVQDIDPSYMWSLLPQSVYPLESRNSLLSHLGGVLYGTIKMSPRAGALEYRAWGGELKLGPDDGYFVNATESGVMLTNGLSSPLVGGALHWRTPVKGLMVGTSHERVLHLSGPFMDLPLGAMLSVPQGIPGSESIQGFTHSFYFAKYENDKLMVAGEYNRLPLNVLFAAPVIHVSLPLREDFKSWYGMASYRLTGKLMGGTYYTQYFNREEALSPARYLKDWVISGRYDFNQYVYAKAEQHLIRGTAGQLGLFDAALNPNGLKPTTKMTILKIGVSF